MKPNSKKLLATSLIAVFLVACGENTAPPSGTGNSDKTSKTVPRLQPVISWNAEAVEIKVESKVGGTYITGNGSRYGYQVSSPSISVKKDSKATVRLDYKTDSGRVCPGILSGNRQSWVLNNDDPVTEFNFNTGKNDAIYIVFANCNKTEPGNPTSRFMINSVLISFDEK